MNILLALDSIKDFENSIEIGNYFKEELESENVNNEVNILPFLDGGNGDCWNYEGSYWWGFFLC